MEEYVRYVNKNTELFSTADPDYLLEELEAALVNQGYKVNIASDKYKIKIQKDVIESEDSIYLMAMNIKILKAGTDKYCVEFNKTQGDQLSFFKEFNTIKEVLGDLVDATL